MMRENFTPLNHPAVVAGAPMHIILIVVLVLILDFRSATTVEILKHR